MSNPEISLDDTNTSVPAGIEEIDSPLGRAAAFLEAVGQGDLATNDGVPDDDDDDVGQEAPAPKAKAKPKDAPPAGDEPAAAEPKAGKDARAEKIEAAKEKLRREHQRRQAEIDVATKKAEADKQLADAQAILREVEPLQRALKDPMALLDLISQRVPPEQLSAALPNWTSDEARQKWHVESTAKDLRESIAEAVKAAVGPLQEQIAQFQAREAKHAEESMHQAFTNRVVEQADETPGFAALMQRNPSRARELAIHVANEMAKAGELPPYAADPEAHFDAVAIAVEKEFFAGAQRQSANTSTNTSAKRHAAGKANPLGNRASSERATVKTEDDDDAVDGDTMEARVRAAERGLRGVPLRQVI